MNDRPIFSARAMAFYHPSDEEIELIVRDSLRAALHISRAQLPPEIGARFHDPDLDDARTLARDVLQHLAAQCVRSRDFGCTIRLSDLASWMIPALLALGLYREHPEIIFRWPDGSPITFAGGRLVTV